ncbi:PREDICTED: uncharacterized acetyltransferase At3g50280-like [Nelumbo nucifera]|uniref:Uncharacterized acetyltransferase At3g50280-like n=1 Tax=Nelumbo nucifera TaxID=4432 RepID=A0A1U8A424_NELNU|nr:PREDICTED: uncharacterized acetyltransferase At3g50280-like [Nelumbo nucifera]
MPFLAVQVTELLDGIFLGCSFNHVIGDGTSFWHFINTWSEVCRKEIKDKAHTMARLKAKANAECKTTTISSLQALSALLWRATTQARELNFSQKTSCMLIINNRPRLNPPLSPNYFGSAIQAVSATTTVGELLSHGLGWAALMLHQAVADHTDGVVRKYIEEKMMAPSVYQPSELFDPSGVMIVGSPRFDIYGNDFGWGEPIAVGNGFGNKFGGVVFAHPGKEGGGSVNLEVCLVPEEMGALESNEEFMEAVSPFHYHKVHPSVLDLDV